MRKLLCAIALATPVVVFTQAPAHSISARAKQLHDRVIVIDSHDDTTQPLIFDTASFYLSSADKCIRSHLIPSETE